MSSLGKLCQALFFKIKIQLCYKSEIQLGQSEAILWLRHLISKALLYNRGCKLKTHKPKLITDVFGLACKMF